MSNRAVNGASESVSKKSMSAIVQSRATVPDNKGGTGAYHTRMPEVEFQQIPKNALVLSEF